MRLSYVISCVFAALLATAPLSSALAKKPQPAPTHPAAGAPVFPIAAVIAQVKTELEAAQSTPGAQLGLKLDTVELNFSLTKTTDVNGKVAIGIPVVGGIDLDANGDRKAEETSSLTVNLVPPEPVAAMSGYDTTNLGITQAIVDTRQQLIQGLNDVPKLDPNKVVITLKFVVTKSGGGSGKIKFLVFTLGGGATITGANSNTITLTFSKSKALQ
ncbi:hypothetical protein BLA39750_04920 [Burkholderia lata]|uniref:Trypsin-co-occurring domain-containing protein n=1 Tax=Burkholderia lata (strain ATCC 17760 / DSM 23089 / LMG 22485 / NCIMB 9086 / R18194 / 383) TaxID=482957 RepID=A0A6P2ZJR4_BURL3|nr:trypco2 family protein [Burkholderia lata]VWD34754.1 hypothetical protein BLA39750_04920 [Burkholderia lata]